MVPKWAPKVTSLWRGGAAGEVLGGAAQDVRAGEGIGVHLRVMHSKAHREQEHSQ